MDNNLPTVAISIDGVIRDFLSKFDYMYRKRFIHNKEEVATNIPTHADIASGDVSEDAFQVKEEFTDEELAEIQKNIEEKEKQLLSLPVDTDDLTIHYKFKESQMKFLQFNDSKGSDKPIKYSSQEMLNKFIYEDYPFQIFGRAKQYQDEDGRNGAIEAAHKIQAFGRDNNLFNVALVSTCKGAAIPATYAFLSTHSCRIKNLHFVDTDEEKWEFCDVLIDDSPKSIQSKPKDKEIIKINRPWNQWDKKVQYKFDSLADVDKKKVLQKIFST